MKISQETAYQVQLTRLGTLKYNIELPTVRFIAVYSNQYSKQGQVQIGTYIQISAQSGPSKVSYVASLVEGFWASQIANLATLSWNLRLFVNKNELQNY